jgi:3-dehydroquinate dehydratase-2
MRILVLNGPNLNLLGQREPEIYGTLTLDELNRQIALYGEEINRGRTGHAGRVELYFYQSNHEGILVDTIQGAFGSYDGIIYNPAAHTHYSIALRDAIASVSVPVAEVHLSDISLREGFRAVSVIADACIGQLKGRGVDSYKDALDLIVGYLDAAAPVQKAAAPEAPAAPASPAEEAAAPTGADAAVATAPAAPAEEAGVTTAAAPAAPEVPAEEARSVTTAPLRFTNTVLFPDEKDA